MMKILIIEDEPELRNDMCRSLQQQHYVVEIAGDYFSAREKLGVYEYDCVLLDIGLPGGTGLELLSEMKQDGKLAGVIIVSAKNSVDDRISGLNMGADDYLSKPFHVSELHARINAVIRRKSFGSSSLLTVNNLVIDSADRTVTVFGQLIELNRKEFDILLYLVINQGRLVTKNALAENVWGDQIDGANNFDFIYSQIKHLRKKLKESDALLEIKAVYGIGYKLLAK